MIGMNLLSVNLKKGPKNQKNFKLTYDNKK